MGFLGDEAGDNGGRGMSKGKSRSLAASPAPQKARGKAKTGNSGRDDTCGGEAQKSRRRRPSTSLRINRQS
jgi:hypothetical protein